MNSLARLLNVDERKGRPPNGVLKVFSIIYCLFRPHQFRYLRQRNHTLQSGQTSYEAGTPWITYDALRFLRANLKKDAKVFEYGSGGSTIFFANRGSYLESVEHDKLWCALVKEKIHDNKKVHLYFKPPQAGILQRYVSSQYPEHNFKSYVQTINTFADETFDVVMVDGRARVSAAKTAAPKVKPGGFLILDNSERSDYAPIFEDLSGWKRWDFYGIGPSELLMWQTTFWQKPKN